MTQNLLPCLREIIIITFLATTFTTHCWAKRQNGAGIAILLPPAYTASICLVPALTLPFLREHCTHAAGPGTLGRNLVVTANGGVVVLARGPIGGVIFLALSVVGLLSSVENGSHCITTSLIFALGHAGLHVIRLSEVILIICATCLDLVEALELICVELASALLAVHLIEFQLIEELVSHV